LLLGEGKVARRGWGAGLLPAPLKGVFCIIRALQEVSRHAILTRIGYKAYIIFRYTLTNTYQHRTMYNCATSNMRYFISIMCTYNVQPVITLHLLCFNCLDSHEFI
jgi:hypothetical protein